MLTIKCVLGMMAVFGFWLIFGGVGIVEASQDWYGIMLGLMTSLIGCLSLFTFALASLFYND